ncbi:hypothetical protein AMS68_003502 [Peltaster fructicola]|uniref:Major facilitator superfamily (MFS) profile domain-containing protein n=1 Tax=Peltaster fructicola TaxID=286661 RepID=A0A6H0XTL8_9PEZI|nr:hypothetical protein AMS68_003502 [Peltaster fructicola]
MQQEALLALVGCSILQLPIWGAAMTFGILQEAYGRELDLDSSETGVIGTTMNGVIYLAMPVLFTLLDGGLLTQRRPLIAIIGVVIAATAWVASSFATTLAQLLSLQGVLAAIGTTMLYSSSTMYLDERFSAGRATAYGAILSSKNIVGTAGPLMISALIQRIGIRWTLRVWALIVLVIGLIGFSIIPRSKSNPRTEPKPVHWGFLKHRTFWIYTIANISFSSGYGLPQTYLPSYARDVSQLSPLLSSLVLTLFNAPGIISCVGVGLLSDKFSFSGSMNVLLVAAGSAIFTLCLWGLGDAQSTGVLIAYAMAYGFFASAFSSTWGGWIKDFEAEADRNEEIVNTGMLYGFFNGARGIGYLLGGVAGVELLKVGSVSHTGGYGTQYGGVVLFTGVSAVVGALSVVQKCAKRVL